MGGINAIWSESLAERLAEALRQPAMGDKRRQLGRERGGRKLAADIAQRVADGVA
jgi:malonate decarboxylase gamma subunit